MEKLNCKCRLRRADFYKQGNANITAYGEFISYDINDFRAKDFEKVFCEESERSSIKNLYRSTGDATDNEIDMDNLTYTYENFGNSNKLMDVDDAVSSMNTGGFIDGNTSPVVKDYNYDENGNMIKDRNKGIANITYNHLNLPTEITFEGTTNKITYLYNAAGQKLKKTVAYSDSIKIVDYLDGFQYAGGVLQFFPHSEGYVKATPLNLGENITDYAYNYVFNYTDHLGNVRLSYTKDPQTQQLKILEENHYYPFGLKHSVYSVGRLKDFRAKSGGIGETVLENVLKTDYQYKYNGKEYQDELNLNVYDMDMRQYDPAIARWVVLDPVIHHSMSPYNAFDNNPVFWADPSGADAKSLIQDMWDKSEEGTNSHWVREENVNKDSGDETQSKDDIRFRDKNGNLIATFETKEIDDDVYLPVEVTDGEPNININVLMRLAGIDIEDVDIVGIGGSWDFAFGMGGSKAIEYVYFLDGQDAGHWQAFIVGKGNVGLNGSAGVYGIIGDYYNDNSLTIGDYAGTSFSFNVGVKGPWIGSYGKFWAPQPNATDVLGIKSYFNKDIRSWTGYTVGGGAGAGIQWSKQNTRIYNP